MSGPSHAELVKVAGGWLRKHGCGVVLLEHHGGTLEVPDAIGFRSHFSVQVECKVSRHDFVRDAKKAGRFTEDGGDAIERWYLVPDGLLREADQESTTFTVHGWGLLVLRGRKVMKVREAARRFPSDNIRRREVTRLYLELRRYQAQGIRYLTVKQLMAKEKADRARGQGQSPPDSWPAWVPCPCCDNFLCTLHGEHAHDCACPPIDDWTLDPYSQGGVAPETCVCAALRFPDGYVVRGHRHDDAMRTAGGMTPARSAKRGDCEQGFLTTAGRFVGREEGLRLQLHAGLESARGGYHGRELFSEDLY